MYSEQVYNGDFWVQRSVGISYCTIFRCNTNSSHHRGTNQFCLMVPDDTNSVETFAPNKRDGFGTVAERHRLSTFRIIVSNTVTRDKLHHAVYTHHRKPGLVVLKYLWLNVSKVRGSEIYKYSS